MRKNFILIVFLLLSVTSWGQLRLKLKSGTYEIPEGTFQGLQAQKATYGIALWDHPVRAEDKKALADLGIELGHYLPENAFEVRLPAGMQASELRRAGLSAFTVRTPNMKLDGPLSIGDYPQWSVLGDGRIAVQFQVTTEFNGRVRGLDVQWLAPLWYTAALAPEELITLTADPNILFVQAIEEPGTPENANSRASARTQYMQLTTNYDGTGVVTSVGDDGDIGPHADYTGRLTSLAGNSIGNHGDHVAGTVFGAGNIDPTARGNAPGSTMIYNDYPDNLTNVDAHYSAYNVRVTNSSYSNGCNAGYTFFAQTVDKDIIDNPSLMHVFSAGNSNGSNCNYGAGSNWGNVTGGHKQGKNVVATANVTATDAIAPSSSRGPAADGRIKPDLAAVGTQVWSTIAGHTYDSYTGTSMASPGAAGYFAVLHNAHDSLVATSAKGGMLKAIAMNTAEDLGVAGPDFIFGYGRINARRAIKVMEDGTMFTGTISAGDSASYSISVPSGAKELRVMVYWTDPQASTSALYALVNNLDCDLTQLTTGTKYLPWVLDPTPNATTLNNPAVRAVDSLNNVEQVTLSNPASGDYTFKVRGTNVPQGPQEYYVVYYIETESVVLTQPYTGQQLVPGRTTFVHWDQAVTGAPSFAWSSNGGQNWTNLGLSPFSTGEIAQWTVPNVATNNAYFRIIVAGDTSIAGPFTIIGTPQNIQLEWACPDSIALSFDPVAGADNYTGYVLGNMYMDPLANDIDTFMVLPYTPVNATWASVSANIGTSMGERAYAIQIPAGATSCPLPTDAGVEAILAPTLISSCIGNQYQVIVRVENPSTQILDTIALAYEIDGTVVRDTFYAQLAPYTDTVITFPQPGTWTGTASKTLKAWSELAGDMNALNDTVQVEVAYINTASYPVPFVQNFDSFTNCPTATNCGATVCGLGGDWTNLVNGVQDDIDWRTNSGGTTSSGTGPSSDFSGNGKYLYLEASGSCEFARAELISPCIDLSGAQLPELRFAYHMFGGNMGELKVRIFDGTMWHQVFSKSGAQPNAWFVETVDLSAFAGQTILIAFEGITGDGFESDMAIDQVEIEDQIGAPVVDFAVSNNAPCLGAPVDLIDQSTKVPTSWTWSISPATYNFVGGTNANSAAPQVSFTAYGTYDITLIATNTYGADTLTKTALVNVVPLMGLPIVETFSSTLAASDLALVNPDGGITWAKTDVRNMTGSQSGAVYMNFFNYSNTGAMDVLRTPTFDITGYTQPALLFDVSYAPYSSTYSDGLAVAVSANCGASFDTLYAKDGTDLATAATSTSVYVPATPADWRTDTVDLSNVNGNQLVVDLVGISGYGNNLYIDNIRIIDLGGAPSMATLSLPSSICEDTPFNFELTSSDTSLQGEFGLNRLGSVLVTQYSGMGPHTATLNLPTAYSMEYVYYNAYTFVADSVNLNPGPQLDADFNLLMAGGLSYQFQDATTPTPNSWFWDFGDGNTSTAQSPTHTYAAAGSYTVKLVVDTDCGVDSITTTFNNIGVEEGELAGWLIYPNPTADVININFRDGAGAVELTLYDALGRAIEQTEWDAQGGSLVWDLSHLPSGIYTVEWIDAGEVRTEKVTKR